MVNQWRLINSYPENPYYNMALDESLFLNYIFLRKPTLRIYSWRMPSFSLGFSQYADSVLDVSKCNSEGMGFVRRMSGGGVLYHDSEITYSVVCSQSDLGKVCSVKESFKLICSFVIRFYRNLGLKPSFSCEIGSSFTKEHTDFCLASLQDYDITISGRKIGGNAQKRRGNVIFQHGSIPIQLDFALIKRYVKQDLSCIEKKATCLDKLTDMSLHAENTIPILVNSFKESFSCDLKYEELSAYEVNRASLLEKQKYSTVEWNIYRKQPKLSESEYDYARKTSITSCNETTLA